MFYVIEEVFLDSGVLCLSGMRFIFEFLFLCFAVLSYFRCCVFKTQFFVKKIFTPILIKMRMEIMLNFAFVSTSLLRKLSEFCVSYSLMKLQNPDRAWQICLFAYNNRILLPANENLTSL